MDYKGVEVIIKQLSETAGPFDGFVGSMTIGVKNEDMGVWLSVAQIVSLLAGTIGHEIPYELEVGELELKC